MDAGGNVGRDRHHKMVLAKSNTSPHGTLLSLITPTKPGELLKLFSRSGFVRGPFRRFQLR